MILSTYLTAGQGEGYSGSAEGLIIALEDLGYDIRVMSFVKNRTGVLSERGKKIVSKPFKMGEVGFCYDFPNAFSSISNRIKIGYTMFETDKLPRTDRPNPWAGKTGQPEDNINKLDTLLVPCKHNKKLFEKEGVKIPIKVVPLGIDPLTYPKIIRPKRDTFTFLMLGKLTQRKNPGAVIGAFLDLFKDREDVRLILKTHSGTLGHLTLPYKNIEIIDGKVPVEKLYWLYKESDCFVLPTRGEGFGLPPLEAMATGIPAIIPNHTGTNQYADIEYTYVIKNFVKTEAKRYPRKWGDVGNWYEPDFEELKNLMARVESNRGKAYQKGLKAADWVRKNYTFKQTALKVHETIQELLN